MIKTDARYIELIRALQTEGLYLTRDPFGKIAELLGWETDEVIELTKALKDAGIIRRFGAALTPRNSGFKSNSMVVWKAEGGEEAGRIMAQHPRISHCYLRPSFEGFPYDLYTMIHADDPEHLERIIEELSMQTGLRTWKALNSLIEFKKTSPVYFPGTPSLDGGK